ncbi:F-box protein SKIP22 [Corchorus capsularis]|uniref:F-box protein SKIP22 n=1 Tax=Corchorus capsularis TaxID=210143 RepID=A0A1R3JFE1_COCAP|nr:F-box protein SKIP22 [Corchorus capsularis]
MAASSKTITDYSQANPGPAKRQKLSSPSDHQPLPSLAMSKGSQFSQEAEEIKETESIERWSEPYFLRKVLKEGLGDDRNMHNLMAMAVHAVLLDSGFVGFDPVSKLQIAHLPDEWSSSPVPIWIPPRQKDASPFPPIPPIPWGGIPQKDVSFSFYSSYSCWRDSSKEAIAEDASPKASYGT